MVDQDHPSDGLPAEDAEEWLYNLSTEDLDASVQDAREFVKQYVEDLSDPALQSIAADYPTGLSWALVYSTFIDSENFEHVAVAQPPLTDPF